MKKNSREVFFMKKLFALILTLCVILSCLTACSSQPADSSAPDSSANSSATDSNKDTATNSDPVAEEEPSTGLPINHANPKVGYINQNKWEHEIIADADYQTMDEEYLCVPAGGIIMCDKRMILCVYYLKAGVPVLDANATAALGAYVKDGNNEVSSIFGINHSFEKDAIIRYSVKGSLDDVTIYVPKDKEDQCVLKTAEQFLEEYESKLAS